MLRPSFQRRMPPTALACLGGALMPTMNIIPLTRCTSRSPATPVPYSFQQRHRAKMRGSSGRLGTVPCHVSQSRFEVERLGEMLRKAAPAATAELVPFYDWVIAQCDAFRQAVAENLRYIDLGFDPILPDGLSKTQVITRNLHLFNRYLVSPVLRARPSDRLCLKVLQWLHGAHPQT